MILLFEMIHTNLFIPLCLKASSSGLMETDMRENGRKTSRMAKVKEKREDYYDYLIN